MDRKWIGSGPEVDHKWAGCGLEVNGCRPEVQPEV